MFPDGGSKPDKTSLFSNFYQTVTHSTFNGILAVNCNMQLDQLPPAIRAVLGGMKDPGIAGFRVHHVGVAINNTDPTHRSRCCRRAQPSRWSTTRRRRPRLGGAPEVYIDYAFEVSYLRALFTNSELRSFACEVDLTINNLFKTGVNLDAGQNVAATAGGATPTSSPSSAHTRRHGTSGDTQFGTGRLFLRGARQICLQLH